MLGICSPPTYHHMTCLLATMPRRPMPNAPQAAMLSRWGGGSHHSEAHAMSFVTGSQGLTARGVASARIAERKRNDASHRSQRPALSQCEPKFLGAPPLARARALGNHGSILMGRRIGCFGRLGLRREPSPPNSELGECGGRSLRRRQQ